MSKLKGCILTFVIAVAATLLGHVFPLVGSAIFALVIGLVINNVYRVPETFEAGIQYSGKKVLHYSIIAMGFTLSFQSLGQTGWKSLPLILSTLFIAGLVVFLLVKWLRIDTHLGILIGVGTSICGGSAIAATSPVIRAKSADIAFAMSTVFLFNLLAVIVFPPLGHMLHLSEETFGFFAGTAINDTSSVVAASANYGAVALETGMVVKLTRTLFIIPVVMFFTYRTVKMTKASTQQTSIRRIFPWFIVWFALASLISTVLQFPPYIIQGFKSLSMFLISMALAGIGLSVDFKQFKRVGMKPVLLGLVTWLVIILASLIVLKIMNMF